MDAKDGPPAHGSDQFQRLPPASSNPVPPSTSHQRHLKPDLTVRHHERPNKELAAVVQGPPRHGLLQIRRARAATDPFPAFPAADSSGSGRSGELSKACRRQVLLVPPVRGEERGRQPERVLARVDRAWVCLPSCIALHPTPQGPARPFGPAATGLRGLFTNRALNPWVLIVVSGLLLLERVPKAFGV